jgi:hypothetical protein
MASSYQRHQNNIFSGAVSSKSGAVGAGSAGFAFLDLIPVEIDTALVFPLVLSSSSGFISIFFDSLVNVAMVDLPKI